MHRIRYVVYLGLALACTGCKIDISSSTNGRIETDSGGYSCAAGATCEINVSDTFFDESFHAIPVQGYKFAAWRTKPSSLCGGSTKACRLTTTGFSGTPLMGILESDQVFFLEPVFGTANTWRPRADMSTAGLEIGSCVINGKLYAVGLGFGVFGPGLGRVEAYDPISNTWTTRASLATPRGLTATGVVGGKCYAIGGGNAGGPQAPPALTAVEVYDPKTDTWQPRAALPQARAMGGSAVVKGKIYVIGGSDRVYWTVTPIAAVAIYDPKTDTWTQGADMPTPRIGLGVAAVDGFIYAVGGSNQTIGVFSSSIVERYDPATNQWSRVADLPEARDYLSAVVLDGKLYAVGGLINPTDQFNGSAPSANSVYRYDPQTDQWTRVADMAVPRWSPAAAALDGQLYVMGGRSARETPSLNGTEEYTP